MAKTFVNMSDPKTIVDTSMDSVIVPHSYESFSIVLDTSNLAPGTEIIGAGHVIIKKDNAYYSQKVTAGVYAALEAGEHYVGILRTSILAAKPMATVTVRGTLNTVAAPYAPLADFATESKFIRLTQDI